MPEYPLISPPLVATGRLPAIGFAFRRGGRVDPTLRPVSPTGWKWPRRGGNEGEGELYLFKLTLYE